MDLPKWPVLMVRGKRLTPEQADKVIIRTSHLPFLGCNDEKWNKIVEGCFGVRHEATRRWSNPQYLGTRRPWMAGRAKAADYSAWERKAEELGVLPLEYLTTDRIASTYADGPSGWVDWDGTVMQKGRGMSAKWPDLDDLTTEWKSIAHAFPFLELEAQIAEEHWGRNEESSHITHRTPLASWTIGNGAAELDAEPGELMFGPPSKEEQDDFYKNLRIPSERGVSEARLRAAVRRCSK